jgi:hypothetical protein
MGFQVVLGFDSRQGLGIFLFTASRTARRPTQPTIQWVPGALSLWVKRPGREADHSHPSNAEVKECMELCHHSPNTPSWRGAQLKKHGDNFTFYLYFTFTFQVVRSRVSDLALNSKQNEILVWCSVVWWYTKCIDSTVIEFLFNESRDIVQMNEKRNFS